MTSSIQSSFSIERFPFLNQGIDVRSGESEKVEPLTRSADELRISTAGLRTIGGEQVPTSSRRSYTVEPPSISASSSSSTCSTLSPSSRSETGSTKAFAQRLLSELGISYMCVGAFSVYPYLPLPFLIPPFHPYLPSEPDSPIASASDSSTIADDESESYSSMSIEEFINFETEEERGERETSEAMEKCRLLPAPSRESSASSITSSSAAIKTCVAESLFDYNPIKVTYSLLNGKPGINATDGEIDPHLSFSHEGNKAHFVFYGRHYYFLLRPGITAVKGCVESMQLTVMHPGNVFQLINHV